MFLRVYFLIVNFECDRWKAVFLGIAHQCRLITHPPVEDFCDNSANNVWECLSHDASSEKSHSKHVHTIYDIHPHCGTPLETTQ